MSLIAKGTGEKFETPPCGLQPAICANVYDLGYQKGLEGKIQHKCALLWELAEKKQDGERFMVTKLYTLSLNEKANLRKDLTSWRTRDFTDAELEGFDLENIIGKTCQLNLVATQRNGSTYVNVDSVLPAARGLPPMVVIVGRDFCPEWIKKMVANALPPPQAPNGSEAPQHAEGESFTDDIPF